MTRSVPHAQGHATAALWLVAGLDPTGGAGLLRDRCTAAACAPKIPVACVVTAWTRQGHGRPATAEPRELAALVRELRSMPRARAIKIGLVPAESLAAVLTEAATREAPIVLDPVLAASDGGDLGARVDTLRQVLKDMAKETWLITPNRAEAAALAETEADDPELARKVAERTGAATLVKAMPAGPGRVRDVLWLSGQVHEFERARVEGPDPRGTGCALSTAIACGLAQGKALPAAIAAAIAWLDAARTRCEPGPDGRMHLPDDGPPLG